jgi:hypothetical protein
LCISLRFPPHQNPCTRLSLPIRSTCPAHPILLDLITRTILDEECRSLSSLLCSFSPLPCYILYLCSCYIPSMARYLCIYIFKYLLWKTSRWWQSSSLA